MNEVTNSSENRNTSGALSGVRVLDCSQSVSGPFCAKLMADFGAEVIKVEPPEGDVARNCPPFYKDIPDKELSGLFLYLNTGKLGTTLNLQTEMGRSIFRNLVKQTDILIENNPPGIMKALGLDYESLKQENPGLVMISLTPFGQSGPYSEHKSYPLNTFHAGGEGYCLPGGLGYKLNPDREPVKAGGHLGEYDAGILGAVVALAAYLKGQLTGVGRFIDLSEQEALLSLMCTELARYTGGWIESRATRFFPIAGLMECKDGFVQAMPFERHMWNGFMDLMGNPDWSKEEGYDFATIYGRPQKGKGITGVLDRGTLQKEVNEILSKWMLEHTKEEIYYGSQERKVSTGMVCTTEDIIKSKQLQAREYFVEIDHSRIGKQRYPGPIYKMSLTPAQIKRPAPLLAEHNKEIYCNRLGFSREQLIKLKEVNVI